MRKFQKLWSKLLLAIMLTSSVGVFTSCFNSDDVGDAYYTFVGETIADYLESNPGIFSEFTEVLDSTGVFDLLSTYGTFTVFAPTNEAMKAYYADSGATSLQDFLADKTYGETARFDALKSMAFYQLIATKAYMVSEFPEGGYFGERNMMNRYISIAYSVANDQLKIIVNGSSEVLLRDQKVHNGVLHAVDKVLVPSNLLLPDYIATDTTRYGLFIQALKATELTEMLLGERDDAYRQLTKNHPAEKLIRYTAFVEPDSVYNEAGIYTYSDLLSFAKGVYDPLYPQYAALTDPTDPNHALNRFIAYHLLDYSVAGGEFTYKAGMYDPLMGDRDYAGKGEGIVDYLFPMAPNTIIEVKEQQVYTPGAGYSIVPVFNLKKDGSCVRWVKQVAMSGAPEATNGVMHEIDNILVFDQEVQNDVFNKRLRIDVYATLPEMMSNKLRPKRDGDATDKKIVYPMNYFSNLTFTEASEFTSNEIVNGSVQYQGCSFYVGGNFDFTQKLPALPEGTWEFRVGTKLRTDIPYIVQIYVDGLPIGIPLDLTKRAEHPDVGSIMDYTMAVEYYGEESVPNDKNIAAELYRDEALKGKPNENDKDLRNRGWMKAPDASFRMYPAGASARDDIGSMRSILGRYDFGPGKDHSLRIKAVGVMSNGSHAFCYDYLEFIPTAQLEDEDIY